MPSDPPSSVNERNLQKLQNKLAALYGRVQGIYDSISQIGNDPLKIENYLADCFTIDILRKDFMAAIEERNSFQLSYSEGPVPTYSSLISFEQLYTKIKYKSYQLTSQMAENTSRDERSSLVKCEKPSLIKLPRLELCSFDGENESWPIFYETFKSAIHNNPSLTDGEKIQYLVGRLKGNALNICKGILPTAENYPVIWDALVNKYNDKRVLAAAYLDKLINLPSVNEKIPSQLEEFIDKFSSLHAALKQLDLESLEDFMFVHIACKKVGLEMVKAFELKFHEINNNKTSCSEFINFIRNQSHILQRAHNSANSSSTTKAGSIQMRKNNNASSSVSLGMRASNNYNAKTFVNVHGKTCLCCGKSDHSQLPQCTKFLSMVPNDRYKLVKSNKLCVNCLDNSHLIINCTDSQRCSECSRSHHSLLHFPNSKVGSGSNDRNITAAVVTGIALRAPESEPAASAVALCAVGECAASTAVSSVVSQTPMSSVLLGTAQCNAIDADGNIFVLRALVDSASQSDLITTECCKRLNLKLYEPQSKYVSGVGDISNPIEGVTCLTIRSRFDDSVRFTIQPVVVNRITSELPTAKIDTTRLDYLNNIQLADSNYCSPANIDLILGTDLFARILGPNSISRSAGEPVAIETLLGYIIIGRAPVINPTCNIVRTYCTVQESLENCMNRFFELEEVPNVPNCLTKDEQACENYYCDTTRRESNGRYVVSLPFQSDPIALGDSMRSAESRYLSLERRLLSNPAIKEEYDSVFKEYLQRNYMHSVGTVAEIGTTNDQYVIPHHAVVRQDKSTTKLRVVLNASNKTSTGKSLNDLLHTGPNLQNDLFQIILKFRLLPVAISADIRQMFLRILTDQNDTKYLRLLYRFDKNDPITVFEMSRVAFGLCCSTYLAIRTVRQLAADERQRFPIAASLAESDLFTDDLVTSCSSVAKGVDLSNQLIDLFAAGGFELVKFSSNSPEVMAGIPATHRVSEAVEFSPDSYLKILGLFWIPAEDVFTFSVNAEHRECTKRNILSTIARLWDLMGFVAPVTLLSKLIIKSLWEDNIGWDDIPPPNIVSLWQTIESELPMFQNIKLPRHIGVNDNCIVSVVGFADASERAYGGVVYLHVNFPNENRSVVNLVCAKSRVAPSKTVITLARMELCANVILSRLMRLVIDAYSERCQISNIYAFTDSTVALAWIHSCPTRWQTFVANRISKIQNELDPRHFHHISGKDNPADCLSRGLTPAQLIEHPLWFNGPPFVRMPVSEWPVHHFDPTAVVDKIPEIKVNVLATTAAAPTTTAVFYDVAAKVSSWSKLLRIVIYVLRFVKKLPRKFVVSHLDQAEDYVIKDLQKIHFASEIKSAESGNKLPPAFLKLNAFLKDGMFRVGGRLVHSELDYDSRHPLLLPRKDHIVNLIIDHYHQKYLHTGPQLLMSLLRQRYWILAARNIVRKRVQQCNICFKVNPRNTAPFMADLPACRVQEAKAFCHTGMDYAGPLHIVPYRRRGVHSIKAYLCLFVCLVTKAVHLELASDLSTDAFLNALKRFISRRGPVAVLYSDNGTNFIGAKSYLDAMYQLLESEQFKDKFANVARDNRIEIKFYPPLSPHFNGMSESNVKSVKNHLKKIVGNQLLTFEEMTTVLVQIEAILNSRPLSVLSSDPSEPLALTPSHFLVMTPLKSLPSEDLTNANVTLLQRKRVVDSLVQSFWKRWKIEYLNTLQVRSKWLTHTKPILEGTVVLLKSENSACLDWPLGVIERTYPGKDKIIRTVDVRTTSGLYKRPLVKVFPLPSQ